MTHLVEMQSVNIQARYGFPSFDLRRASGREQLQLAAVSKARRLSVKNRSGLKTQAGWFFNPALIMENRSGLESSS